MACASPGTSPKEPSTFSKSPAPPQPAKPPQAPASTADADRLVDISLEEARFRFTSDGRLRRQFRQVYRVLSPAALSSGWGTVAVAYSPWIEQRPAVEATVRGPDGSVRTLDPATLEESGGTADSPTMFRDRRVLRGPLPNLKVGSEVELNLRIDERARFFTGGSLVRYPFDNTVPIGRARVVIEADADLPLRVATPRLKLEPAVHEADGRVRWVWETTSVPPRAPTPVGAPPESLGGPRIEASIGPSWSTIARAYGELVEKQIERAGALPEVRVAQSSDRDQTLRSLVNAVHRHVRYTGLELGASSIVPADPTKVWERAYGDCKDKATLLVALLRQRGIEAHVALVRAGYGPSVQEELPSLDAFDHAVVWVPGEVERWIDATVESQAIDYIPTSLQGRKALIAREQTRELTEIPELPSHTNVYREDRRVEMAEYGAGRVRETTRGLGMMDLENRFNWGYSARERLLEGLTEYAASLYGAESISRVERTVHEDTDRPVELQFTAEDASVVQTADDEAWVQLSRQVLFRALPDGIFDSDFARREAPFFFYEPYVAEVRYAVDKPAGFEVRNPIDRSILQMGPATFSTSFEDTDDTVYVTYRFDTGPRRWSPDEIRAFVAAADGVPASQSLWLEHRSVGLWAQGQRGQALAVQGRISARAPESAVERARLSQLLLRAHMGLVARHVAGQAVRIEPETYLAQFQWGRVHLVDPFGRAFRPGFDRPKALGAFRAAISISPNLEAARRNLALTLEHGPDGRQWGPGADLNGALEVYRALDDGDDHAESNDDIRSLLLLTDRFEAVGDRARTEPASPMRNAQWVAATALGQGVNEALTVLGRVSSGDDRRQTAVAAASWLVFRQDYTQAAALLQASISSFDTELKELAEHFADLRPRNEARDTPSAFARTWWVRGLSRRGSVAHWQAHWLGSLADGAPRPVDGGQGRAERLTRLAGPSGPWGRQWNELEDGYGVEYVLDRAFDEARVSVATDGVDGLRLQLRPAPDQPVALTIYAVRAEDTFRIWAGDGDWSALGAKAHELLKRGRTTEAEQWLRWISREARRAKSAERAVQARIFEALWSGSASREPKRAEQAAAAMMAPHPDLARSVLTELKPALDDPALAGDAASRVLWVRALRAAGRKREAAKEATALARSDPTFARWSASVTAEAGRPDRALAVLDRLAQRKPDDVAVARERARILLEHEGDARSGFEILRALATRSQPRPGLWADCLRASLLVDPPSSGMVELARSAAAFRSFVDPDTLFLLAAVHAHRGELDEAIEAFAEASKHAAIMPADYLYVQARAAEHLGLREAAAAAYRQMDRSTLLGAHGHARARVLER